MADIPNLAAQTDPRRQLATLKFQRATGSSMKI